MVHSSHSREVGRYIHDRLRSHGHSVAFVGDTALALHQGVAPVTMRVVTDCPPAELSELFPGITRYRDRFILPLSGERVFAIDAASSYFAEIFCEEGNRVADRQDTNVERLLVDLEGDVIGDPFEALPEIAQGVVKCLSEDPDQWVNRNPVAAIKAIRLTRLLKNGGRLHAKLHLAVKRNAAEVLRSEIQGHLGREMAKVMLSRNRASILEEMHKMGVLPHVFSSVTALEDTPLSTKHHGEGGPLTHTFLAVSKLGAKASLSVSFGTLFHDVGKSKTAVERGDGIVHPDHEFVGARMARSELLRLGYAPGFVGGIFNMIVAHMTFFIRRRVPNEGLATWIVRTPEEEFNELFELHVADATGREKPSEPPSRTTHPIVVRRREVLEEHEEVTPLWVTPALIEDAGIRLDNHLAREILGQARVAQEQGEIIDRDSALEWLRAQLTGPVDQLDFEAREGVA